MSSASNNLNEIPFSGKSMSWFLVEGDKLLMNNEVKDFFPGDLVIFQFQGELSCHRIINIIDGKYLCKGDFSISTELVQKENILGRVDGIRRNGNRFYYQRGSFVSKLYVLISKLTSKIRPIRYIGIGLIYLLQKIDFSLNMNS
ncbi:MAG: hypothetical protein GY909_03260 [Oligoflexia bacterium]|nr:hypothetical protein [Oligoflexia bacterium]